MAGCIFCHPELRRRNSTLLRPSGKLANLHFVAATETTRGFTLLLLVCATYIQCSLTSRSWCIAHATLCRPRGLHNNPTTNYFTFVTKPAMGWSQTDCPITTSSNRSSFSSTNFWCLIVSTIRKTIAQHSTRRKRSLNQKKTVVQNKSQSLRITKLTCDTNIRQSCSIQSKELVLAALIITWDLCKHNSRSCQPDSRKLWQPTIRKQYWLTMPDADEEFVHFS